MSVMTSRHPDGPERRLTVDDLENTPDDGRRYELADGRLDVSPAPTDKHFRAASRLNTFLNTLCQGELEIGEGPGVNLNSERTSHRIPDLAVFDCDMPEGKYFDVPPLLAVEIVSAESVLRATTSSARSTRLSGSPPTGSSILWPTRTACWNCGCSTANTRWLHGCTGRRSSKPTCPSLSSSSPLAGRERTLVQEPRRTGSALAVLTTEVEYTPAGI